MKLFKSLVAFGVLCSLVFAHGRQKVLSGETEHVETESSATGAQTLQLSSIPSDEFIRFSHPAFPGRSARIKKSDFCDGGVASYAGYIDAGPKHFFFYFFESRSKPDEDDVLLWTNGGPGGSSALGLFMELGPCRIASPNSTKYNPYSWNTNANVFFIDQPIGTGFSYNDLGDVVSTTEEAAQDVAAFVAMFFETFDKFKGRNFHLTGESYAGRYLPVFGAAVYDQNAVLIEKGLEPISLKSIVIGNGVTDFFSVLRSYYDMQCTNAGIGPFQPISTCVRMKQTVPRCEKRQQEACLDHFDSIDCTAAFSFCITEFMDPYRNAGYNVYDMTMKCSGLDCYPEEEDLVAYLNTPSVRKSLGVTTTKNFSTNAREVHAAFWSTADQTQDSKQYVIELLARQVKVLIYAGTHDFIANWLGNEWWTLSLDWPGRSAFSTAPLEEWLVDGNPAGKSRTHGNLSFVTINGAGHLPARFKNRISSSSHCIEILTTMKLVKSLVAFGLLCPLVLAQSQQSFLSGGVVNVEVESATSGRTIQLSSIPSDEFTRFSHPAFPGRSARIKKSDFCDGGVASYTGYIDVGPKHFFFYFFESRSNPDEDDVLLWTNGGPGGSSALGLFLELGPCRIASPNSTKYNPYSWNTNANLFFIDQPIGTGFSYNDLGDVASTTEEAAQDIAAFAAMFFETFDNFKGRNFHLTGESYAGRYLPLFGAAVYDQNSLLIEKGLAPINLKSIAIGNGITDYFSVLRSYYDMQCTNAGIGPLQPISTCIPRCEKQQKEACLDHFDSIDCSAAFSFCITELMGPYNRAGYNAYDMTMKCGGLDCYPEEKDLVTYLNTPSVHKALGVDITKNFSTNAREVHDAFWSTADQAQESKQYVVELLARRVKVLIYAGTHDFICNWLGNERWTLSLDWPGRSAFSSVPLEEWFVDGSPAGKSRMHGNFSFATINGAGHLAPHDKPVESLALIQRWLADEPF
ncbi:alpha/beta-hydrolase [Fomitiporia mediterranea MF3/22]|uniref:alpha/beta-hydrolase n=1 Tax=Fomitiporia mediterranea (strain MF3/22) TaxID=694068 RepID=UPI000440856F|nr:alpha/beta-hydrolase [Fomitiporia mediterranea MF3/22]EJD07214.1 alpha/beta-hydrolase [Fomitiporia mediterranea MF3/22]